MENKRKRIQNDSTTGAAKVASSNDQRPVKTTMNQATKDKTINYLNKPYMEFK